MKKMKKLSLFTLIAFFILIPSLAFAHEFERSVEQITADIMQDQNATALSQINCTKVPEIEFEELGDAVMDRMISDKLLHNQMHEMMGGEDSESVKQMHIAMGKNWLGCEDKSQAMMNMNMMSMMTRMMGNYYTQVNYYLNLAIIGWALFILSTIALVLLHIKKKPTKRKGR